MAAQVHNCSDLSLNIRVAMVSLTIAIFSTILVKINKMFQFIPSKLQSEYPNKQWFLQENYTFGDAKFYHKKRA